MKKLIIISSILALVIGFGIAECIFTDTYYNGLSDKLETAQSLVLENKNDDACAVIVEAISSWEEKKIVIYLIGNHNTAHNLYERIINSYEYLKAGEKSDALAYLSSAIFLAREIAREVMPSYGNVF